MKQQLVNMLALQNKMNSKVHPQWQEQQFEWYRAVWTECAELMDHHGWKWWKKQNPDLAQIQLEIVDIWHFGMSILLQSGSTLEDVANLIERQWTDTQDNVSFLDAVEQLASDTLNRKSFSIPLFCQLMRLADLDLASLYQQYIGKNVLNFFRQDHGYKQGNYIKVWQDREDNEHLADILGMLDPNAADFQEAVYSALEHRYPDA
ncbi:MAG: dUTP diphosphatase [Ketobacter sp.]|nr:MAG: dUTP diphosphatase [Ketobacter sp.]